MGTSTILIVADTHGDLSALTAVLRWAGEQGIRSGAFLGDGAADLSDATQRSGVPLVWTVVRGNGDHDPRLPGSALMDCGGVKLFLCHGHQHGVLEGPETLASTARAMGADVALFGHTHRPLREKISDLLVLNPGSLGRPRGQTPHSFATLACPDGGEAVATLWKLTSDAQGKRKVRRLV